PGIKGIKEKKKKKKRVPYMFCIYSWHSYDSSTACGAISSHRIYCLRLDEGLSKSSVEGGNCCCCLGRGAKQYSSYPLQL
ncbi:hypothetical protein ACJX0J_025378, partial [Zea mays]